LDAKTERKERETAPAEETRAQPRSDQQKRPAGDDKPVKDKRGNEGLAQDTQADNGPSDTNRSGLIRRHPYIAAIVAILILLVIAAVAI
jgi:membrane fusion protein (multidrug efflux system)